MDYDFLFKVLVVGESGVGKSALMRRFTDNKFSEYHISTIGVDYGIQTFDVDGKSVKLMIHDLAGQERFRSVTASYFRGAHGIIMAYDITDRESFEAIERWLHDIRAHAPTNVRMMLVGTKSDMAEKKRQVIMAEGQQFADDLKIPFIETSSKTSDMVRESFVQMGRGLVAAIHLTPSATVVQQQTINVSGCVTIRREEELTTKKQKRWWC